MRSTEHRATRPRPAWDPLPRRGARPGHRSAGRVLRERADASSEKRLVRPRRGSDDQQLVRFPARRRLCIRGVDFVSRRHGRFTDAAIRALPDKLPDPDEEIVGAEALHRIFVEWRTRLRGVGPDRGERLDREPLARPRRSRRRTSGASRCGAQERLTGLVQECGPASQGEVGRAIRAPVNGHRDLWLQAAYRFGQRSQGQRCFPRPSVRPHPQIGTRATSRSGTRPFISGKRPVSPAKKMRREPRTA